MLLDELVRRQSGAGESDRAFSERLGIPRETWVALKGGRVKMDGRVAVRISRAIKTEFPDLLPSAVDLLLDHDTDSSAATPAA